MKPLGESSSIWFQLDGDGPMCWNMALFANNLLHHIVIGIDNCLKCIHDKLQKIVYVFGHVGCTKDDCDVDGLHHKEGEGMNPTVCESVVHSPLEALS